MDKYLKAAFRGAIFKFANFISDNFIALFLSFCLIFQTLRTFFEEVFNRYRGTGQNTDDIGDAFVILGQLKASFDPGSKYLSGLTQFPIVQINDIYLNNAVCAFTDYAGIHFRDDTFYECGLIHSVMTGAEFVNCTFSNVLANYSDFSKGSAASIRRRRARD